MVNSTSIFSNFLLFFSFLYSLFLPPLRLPLISDTATQNSASHIAFAGTWYYAPSTPSHQENCIYIIEEKNWRIILYYLELAQINANYMTLHFLLNQKGPRKF